jgi:hypothetical protein
MIGTLSRKTASRNSLTSWSLGLTEALILLGLGAAAVVMHQVLRAPLGLSGRHGIEWMALLLLGRVFSRFRGAASLSSLGAAAVAMLPLWGITDDPFIWLIYMLPGPIMDFVFWALPQLVDKIWFLALLGGLAHTTKPIARAVIVVAMGWSYGSFRNGVLVPTLSHFLFGAIGGFLAAVIVMGIRLLPQKE